MIKNIYSASPYIIVDSGVTASSPYVNMNNISAGMVRYNGNSSTLEVYDGNTWCQIDSNGHAGISLTSDAINAIKWAQEKIQEEQKLKQLAKDHPAVADALNKLKTASDELMVITALVENSETQGK